MLCYGDIIRQTGRNNCWNFIFIGFPPAFSPCTGGMKPGLKDHRSATHIWTRPTRTQKIELYFIMEKYISYTCQVWNKTTQGKARSNRRFIAQNRMGDKCVWYHLSAYHREINQLTSQNMSWNIRSYSGAPKGGFCTHTCIQMNPRGTQKRKRFDLL